MLNEIIRSILGKKILIFYHDFLLRVVEPYIVGLDEDDRYVLYAFQFDGESYDDNLGFQTFPLDEIDYLVETNDSFPFIRSGYEPRLLDLKSVICAIHISPLTGDFSLN